MVQFAIKLVTIILLPFFGKIFSFQISSILKKCQFFSKIFKLTHNLSPNYFKNIQYCKIYFHYGLVCTKTSYNYSTSFFGNTSLFKFRLFSEMAIFLKFSNCRIILAQITYFVNIQYGKIYFHYGLVCTKTSYNYSASVFGKIFQFQISIILKNVNFSQIFKLLHNFSQST